MSIYISFYHFFLLQSVIYCCPYISYKVPQSSNEHWSFIYLCIKYWLTQKFLKRYFVDPGLSFVGPIHLYYQVPVTYSAPISFPLPGQLEGNIGAECILPWSLWYYYIRGGTTLNKPPIGLHVKILNFSGRFEAFSARYGMFLFHQPIQNRWKFNICFNVWVVFRLVFAVRACKQRPPCFWPVFKPQNAIPTSSHYTGLLS